MANDTRRSSTPNDPQGNPSDLPPNLGEDMPIAAFDADISDAADNPSSPEDWLSRVDAAVREQQEAQFSFRPSENMPGTAPSVTEDVNLDLPDSVLKGADKLRDSLPSMLLAIRLFRLSQDRTRKAQLDAVLDALGYDPIEQYDYTPGAKNRQGLRPGMYYVSPERQKVYDALAL